MYSEKDDIRNVSYDFPISEEETACMHEANDTRNFKSSLPHRAEYIRRTNLGFYNNFSNIDDDLDDSSLLARKMACTVSPSVVSLSCKNSSDLQQSSSGIVVEYKGIKKILTSAYIIGGHSNAIGLKVEILLPSGKKIDGTVSLIDDHHNIAIIHGDLDGIKGTSLCLEIAPLDVNVMSLGRNSTFGLMASRGKINIRRDVLESDDLMSSSCTISESGIGGPLVDISTGSVIGMNVYMQKKATLFMPSIILNHCFQQLVDYGRVMRPCLGLKTRSIGEKKLNKIELIYEKFPSTDGITVNEVIKESLADEARISVGDIIILLNNIPVSSPLQLADLLLKLGKASRKRKRNRKQMIIKVLLLKLGKASRKRKRNRKQMIIKVVLQRPTTSKLCKKKIELKYPISPYVNRWPLLPLDIPVEYTYDILSYKRGMT